MTEVRKLVKGERIPLPVALIGGSGAGWVTADPAIDGLLIVPKMGADAVIMSDADLADFGYVRKGTEERATVSSSTDNKPQREGASKRRQRDGGPRKSGV